MKTTRYTIWGYFCDEWRWFWNNVKWWAKPLVALGVVGISIVWVILFLMFWISERAIKRS